MEVDAKEVLYSVLAAMDRHKIESTIVSNPSEIPRIMRDICTRCIESLNSFPDYDRPKTFGSLIEALMHYLLSITMIPSERKVKYNKDLEICLVIPTLRQLQTDPNRTLLITFPKCLDRNDLHMHVDRLLKVQPNKKNIWLVFGYRDEVFDSYRDLTVFVQDDFVRQPFKPLSCIIDEIRLFIETNRIKSFRIFRT